MITAASPPSKICCACARDLPLENFRRRRRDRDARQGRCRSCYNAYMRLYRQAARSCDVARFAAQVRQEQSRQRVALLCAGMITRLGGLDAFCVAWKAHIDAARPGSRAALNSFLALARLAESLETHDGLPVATDLSDSELDREIQMLIAGQEVLQ